MTEQRIRCAACGRWGYLSEFRLVKNQYVCKGGCGKKGK